MAEVVRLSVSPSKICDLIVAVAGHQGQLGDALIRGASELAIKRVPIEGSNRYEQHPDDLTDLRKSLDALAAEAGPAFDLSPAISAASSLEELCARLSTAAAGVTPARARIINDCLQALGRALVPYRNDVSIQAPARGATIFFLPAV